MLTFPKLTLKGNLNFPGKNINQSDYGNNGDYGSTEILQHQLFRNFKYFTKLQRE